MRNLKLTIEYDGTKFFGWQKQSGKRTVQGELETAFAFLSSNAVTVEGSGRTDKGVHALGQVASVQFDNPMPLKKVRPVLNKLLPLDIRIKKVEIVSNDFHARFSAKRKTYKYLVKLTNPNEKLSVFEQNYIANYPYKNLDLQAMKDAAKVLIGKHNFKSFCSADTNVSSFEREIFDIKILKKNNLLSFEIVGNGFLYNMVRIIVGTLLEFGRKGLSQENMKQILQSSDRKNSGKTMPACGLYLKCVEYI